MQSAAVHANVALSLLDSGHGPSQAQPPKTARNTEQGPDEKRLRETFEQFAGEVFFGQLLKAMRKTVGKPAYFYGGRAEEVFRGQLDMVLAEKLAHRSGEQLAGPMFELFGLSRR